jgi:hypothetical protein
MTLTFPHLCPALLSTCLVMENVTLVADWHACGAHPHDTRVISSACQKHGYPGGMHRPDFTAHSSQSATSLQRDQINSESININYKIEGCHGPQQQKVSFCCHGSCHLLQTVPNPSKPKLHTSRRHQHNPALTRTSPRLCNDAKHTTPLRPRPQNPQNRSPHCTNIAPVPALQSRAYSNLQAPSAFTPTP